MPEKLHGSKEFIYLASLIKTGKARFSVSQFFVRNSLVLWLTYRDNQILIWAYGLVNIFTSEWFCVPFSIFLAWRLHIWWLIVVGIAFSWMTDWIIKFMTYYFLPESLLQDEKLLDFLWMSNPPHISIQSTKEAQNENYPKGKMPIIMIIPPQPWQSVVEEFEKENH
jgi:hypothetical protein